MKDLSVVTAVSPTH